MLLGQPQVPVAKIEPVRICIQLHGDFVAGGGLENCGEVESVSVTAKQKPAGGMSDDRDVRVPNCLQQTRSHFLGSLVEVGMNAGDDQVHLFEHRIGKIEGAVGEDIYFNSGENPDSLYCLTRLVNSLDM